MPTADGKQRWVRTEADDAPANVHPEAYAWDAPTQLARQAVVVKHSPTRAVIRVEPRGAATAALYIKRYRFSDLRRRIKTALGGSRAMAEWRACRAVRAHGIGAPRPLFAGDLRLGVLDYESYLVTESIDDLVGADTLVERASAAQRVDLLRRLGRVVGHLHLAGVFHDDLKPAHVLLCDGVVPENGLQGVSLIDLYRCRVGATPSMRRRGVNLAQLYMGLADPGADERRALIDGFVDVLAMPARGRARLERSLDRAIRVRRNRRRRRARPS